MFDISSDTISKFRYMNLIFFRIKFIIIYLAYALVLTNILLE